MQAGEYTNGVSINLLAGISRNEKYFTFGGLANIIHNNASGIQFAGLFNTIGNEARGLQFAGLYNYAGTGNGFLFGGLANTVKNDYNGIMFGGLFNSTNDFRGFQFGGLANIAGDVDGFQFAGLVNVAKSVKGVQFGTLLNIADHSDYPIGFVNIIKDGEKSIGVTYDETGNIMASFRSGGRVLYGILGFGYNHKADNDTHYVAEGGFGAHIPIVERFRINTELKGQFINDFSDNFISKTSFSILPAFKITPQLEIFAGPSINYMNTDDVASKDLFPSGNLWKKFKDDRLQQLYIGYTAGIQWIF